MNDDGLTLNSKFVSFMLCLEIKSLLFKHLDLVVFLSQNLALLHEGSFELSIPVSLHLDLLSQDVVLLLNVSQLKLNLLLLTLNHGDLSMHILGAHFQRIGQISLLMEVIDDVLLLNLGFSYTVVSSFQLDSDVVNVSLQLVNLINVLSLPLLLLSQSVLNSYEIFLKVLSSAVSIFAVMAHMSYCLLESFILKAGISVVSQNVCLLHL